MRKLFLFLLPACALIFGVASSAAQENEAASSDEPRVEDEIQALIDKVYPAFVLIGGGSGVCISPDGYMLTNHHVASNGVSKYDVDGALIEIPVRMAGDGRYLTAYPVGGDPRGDIVMLKIESEEPLPFVPLANSDEVQIGDLVAAVGNPFLLSGIGSEPSVSFGVVSATNRYQGGYSECFQVDAPVNPGNSGGPSFNIKGEIIGINGRIMTRHGQRYNTGVGFVISAAQISRFVEIFKQQPGGSVIVRHGLVSGLAMEHDKRLKGCEVGSVAAGSTAEAAGFESADIITHIEGYAVGGWRGFYGKLGTWPQGSQLEFGVRRGDELLKIIAPLDVPVVLNQMPLLPHADDADEEGFIFQFARHIELPGTMPNMFPIPAPSALLGLQLKPTGSVEGGFQVTGFGPGRAAEVLQINDILTKIAGRDVKYMANIKDCLLGYKGGDTVKVTFHRHGVEQSAELVLN